MTVEQLARQAHKALQKSRLESKEDALRLAALNYVTAVTDRGSEREVYDEWDALQKAAEELTRFKDELLVEKIHDA